VAPPTGIGQAPDAAVLAQVLRVEDRDGESNAYSAYAFRGPRRASPYRHLHQVGQPHPWDISGWAENLRWALEQRILFAQIHPEAMGWTESPEHMACIERERTQQIWASDELLEQLLEDDEDYESFKRV
jgi:hypothetical protein